MLTLLERRVDIDVAMATDDAMPAAPEPEVFDDYVPDTRGAPRSARRIAMAARRQQDRRLTGW